MIKLFAIFSFLVAFMVSAVPPVFASEDTRAIKAATNVAEAKSKVEESTKAETGEAVKVSEDKLEEKSATDEVTDAAAEATKDDATNEKKAEEEEPDCE